MMRLISKNKLEFSRKLRKQPTVWESKLWSHLKNKGLGFRFKRQVVVGDYIVDLCCFEKKLVIEIDGNNHRKMNPLNNDQIKLNYLVQEGYKVLRFWNSEIDKNISEVLNRIIENL